MKKYSVMLNLVKSKIKMDRVSFFQSSCLFKIVFGVFFFLLMGGIVARNSFFINYEVVLGVLFLFSLLLFSFNLVFRRLSSEFPSAVKKWFFFFLVFWVLNIAPEIVHFLNGEPYLGRLAGLIERYSHLLFIVSFFYIGFFYRNVITVTLIWKLLILSSLFVAWVILYEAILLGSIHHRFGFLGSSFAIDFGIYANSLFIVLLGGFFWRKELGPYWIMALFLAILVCLLGAILSQSRTAWIGWPEAIIGWGGLYFYFLYKQKKFKKLLMIFVFLGIFIFVIIASPISDVLVKRTNLAVQNVQGYLNGVPTSSLGYRFVMYEIAVNKIKEKPWLGIGSNNFSEFIANDSEALFKEKYNLPNHRLNFSHIHNQFLMSQLTRGILATISLVLLFVFLISYFLNKLKNSDNVKYKSLAMAGMVFTVASFMTFMSESPLSNKTQFLFFFLMATMLVVINSNIPEDNQKDI